MQYAIFEDTLNPEEQTSFIFLDLQQVIGVNCNDSLAATATTITELQQQGLYIVTHVLYEANCIFYPQLKNKTNIPKNKSLINFYAFKHKIKFCSKDLPSILLQHLKISLASEDFSKIFNMLEFENDYAQYQQKFAQVQQFLTNGESYQVNLTLNAKLTSTINNDLHLYYLLSRAQKVAYAAFLPLNSENIISISPELFFKKAHDHIYTKPMKGTMARGFTSNIDHHNFKFLQNDIKNLAENTIVVDLLRNDMCKISQSGTTHTKNLFNIEAYSTLFQMTSEIHSKINSDTNILDILQGLFPCGSITGAPKLRTMEIIAQIEVRLRDTYTGCIGFIEPNNDMIFNVAIRTLTKAKNELIYNFGVGGGVTTYSRVNSEWNEIKVKVNFLRQFYQPDFCLTELMQIHNQKIINYSLHLQRLFSALERLNFTITAKTIQNSINDYLDKNRESLNPSQIYQLKIKIGFAQIVQIDHELQSSSKKNLTISLHNQPLDTSNPLFNYCTDAAATTGLYNKLYAECKQYNIDEIIFKNNCDIITESKNFNLVIQLNELLYTSPSNQGLLIRFGCQKLIEAKLIILKPITTAMFMAAEAYFLCDDFDGLIKCNYIESV